MPDPTPAPLTPAQPFMGAIPPGNNNTYPVQSVAPQQGSSGGLVNVAGQIQGATQAAQNQINQGQQMNRAGIEFQEKQAAQAAAGDNIRKLRENAPGYQPTGNSSNDAAHASFMSNVLHGLHSIGAGVQHAFGGGAPQGAIPQPQQGPPAPPPPQQGPPPPGMQRGGVVGYAGGGEVDNGSGTMIHKTTLGEKLTQGVSDLASSVFGEGAAARAAEASRKAVSDAQRKADQEAQGLAAGGVVTPPQPQPTMLAFANGGEVPTMPQGIPLPFLHVPPPGAPTLPGYASGGAVADSHGGGFGVTDMGVRGIRGFADGGAVPQVQPTAQIQAADQSAQGQQIQGQQANQANTQFQQQQTAQQGAAQAVHALAQDMQSHVLNDDGVPAHAAAPAGAVPTPQAASAQAAQSVAAAPPDDPARTGEQTTSPSKEGKPHSIPFDKWTEWDQSSLKAAEMAARAGGDPGQTLQALNATRNAFVQGHVLRYLSSANVALLNGDSDGVEKALKNAYYYLPDGAELQTKKVDGKLMYQDPINPMIDAKGQSVPLGTPGGKPNMVPVDAAHIQMLGTAMLDPQNVQNTIMAVRSAQAKISLEQSQARAAENTGLGNFYRGMGINKTGTAHLQEVAGINWKNLASGQADLIRANAYAIHFQNYVKEQKLDPQLVGGMKTAADMTEKAIQGQLSTTNDPLSGTHTMRDPAKSALPNATPAEVANATGLAGKIFASNPERGQAEASRLAILGTAAHRNGGMHKDPATGKPTHNFVTKGDDAHIWNPQTNAWEPFKLHPGATGSVGSGGASGFGANENDVAQALEATLGAGGGGGPAKSGIPEQGGEATAENMQDQQFAPESE